MSGFRSPVWTSTGISSPVLASAGARNMATPPVSPVTAGMVIVGDNKVLRLPCSGDYSSWVCLRSRLTSPRSIASAEGPTVILMARVLKRGCSNRSSC